MLKVGLRGAERCVSAECIKSSVMYGHALTFALCLPKAASDPSCPPSLRAARAPLQSSGLWESPHLSGGYHGEIPGYGGISPRAGSGRAGEQTRDQKCSAAFKSLALCVLKIHVYVSYGDAERFNNQSRTAGTRMQELQGPVVCAVNLLRDSTAVITM